MSVKEELKKHGRCGLLVIFSLFAAFAFGYALDNQNNTSVNDKIAIQAELDITQPVLESLLEFAYAEAARDAGQRGGSYEDLEVFFMNYSKMRIKRYVENLGVENVTVGITFKGENLEDYEAIFVEINGTKRVPE